MNRSSLLLAIALAVAMTTAKVDGNPHARHARAVAAKASTTAAKPLAAPAGLTAAMTIPQLLAASATNIQLGTAPKTGVAALDTFAAAVTNISKLTKPTAKQLADFGTKAVTSLCTATKAAKANQTKLQTAVTNGLKVAANQNFDGVLKLIGNNAKLLGPTATVTPVLQKMLVVDVPSAAGLSSFMSNLNGIDVSSLYNSVGAGIQQQLTGQGANGGAVNVSSLFSNIGNTLAGQPGINKLPGSLNISSIFKSVGAGIGAQNGQPLNVSSLIGNIGSQLGMPANTLQGGANTDFSSLFNSFLPSTSAGKAGSSQDLSSMFGNLFKG